MKPASHDAVSPVIGVMLMLVVTIIIAAVVSAFASGSMGNTAKTPSATIKGVFSQSGGMQIIHTGGDVLSTANLLFTVSNDASFGQALGTMTTQVLDKTKITDAQEKPMIKSDGTANITSFSPGQTLYISWDNLNPSIFQPLVVPNDISEHPIEFNGRIWTYSGSKVSYWRMCFVNPDSVGKTFTLLVSDKSSGAVIARSTVVIAP